MVKVYAMHDTDSIFPDDVLFELPWQLDAIQVSAMVGWLHINTSDVGHYDWREDTNYRAWVIMETWCNPYERKKWKDSIYVKREGIGDTKDNAALPKEFLSMKTDAVNGDKPVLIQGIIAFSTKPDDLTYESN